MPSQSHFRQNSFFDTTEDRRIDKAEEFDPHLDEESVPKAAIKHSQLEDWSHRLHAAAYEAGDTGNDVLESNLLDLRDEVVFELHQRLL